MEVYLTKAFFDRIDQQLLNRNPNFRISHGVRKKIMDVYGYDRYDENSKQQFKDIIQELFRESGIEVSFRV